MAPTTECEPNCGCNGVPLAPQSIDNRGSSLGPFGPCLFSGLCSTVRPWQEVGRVSEVRCRAEPRDEVASCSQAGRLTQELGPAPGPTSPRPSRRRMIEAPRGWADVDPSGRGRDRRLEPGAAGPVRHQVGLDGGCLLRDQMRTAIWQALRNDRRGPSDGSDPSLLT